MQTGGRSFLETSRLSVARERRSVVEDRVDRGDPRTKVFAWFGDPCDRARLELSSAVYIGLVSQAHTGNAAGFLLDLTLEPLAAAPNGCVGRYQPSGHAAASATDTTSGTSAVASGTAANAHRS